LNETFILSVFNGLSVLLGELQSPPFLIQAFPACHDSGGVKQWAAKDAVMDKEKIIARLREHQSDLKSGGIERLFLFGSHARGTAVRIHPMWI
jgi:hypothetical protein